MTLSTWITNNLSNTDQLQTSSSLKTTAMKEFILSLFIFVSLSGDSIAQYDHVIIHQPDASAGKDADLFSATEWENQNFGASTWCRAESWTRK